MRSEKMKNKINLIITCIITVMLITACGSGSSYLYDIKDDQFKDTAGIKIPPVLKKGVGSFYNAWYESSENCIYLAFENVNEEQFNALCDYYKRKGKYIKTYFNLDGVFTYSFDWGYVDMHLVADIGMAVKAYLGVQYIPANLFDIEDSQIENKLGVAIPDVVKKGVGSLSNARIEEGSEVYYLYLGFNDVARKEFNALCDYYKDQGGKFDEDQKDKMYITFSFDWGKVELMLLFGYQLSVRGFINK